jgi:hypothetical protein
MGFLGYILNLILNSFIETSTFFITPGCFRFNTSHFEYLAVFQAYKRLFLSELLTTGFFKPKGNFLLLRP